MGAIELARQDVVEGVLVENMNPGSYLTTGNEVLARPDLMALVLENTTSESTRKTYSQGWKTFFGDSPRLGETWARDPQGAVWTFVTWPRPVRALEALEFRARLIKAKKAPSTITTRQAAVRSVVKMAHTLGYCEDTGTNLFPRTKVVKGADLRGIKWDKARLLITLPAKLFPEPGHELLRLRDTALFMVMCECALRSMSVRGLDVGDWSRGEASLRVREKGKGESKRPFELLDETNEALYDYVRASGHLYEEEAPLFQSLHRGANWKGGRITPNGMGAILRRYAAPLGVKRLHPHKLRHTAISHAADVFKGDLLAIKDLSGHADIRTVEHYARQAKNRQGEISKRLGRDLRD